MTISGISAANIWSGNIAQKSANYFHQGKVSTADTLRKMAANLSSQVTETGESEQEYISYMLDKEKAFGIIGTAEESLSDTQGLLEEIQELVELASNPMLDQQDRDTLQKRLEELLNRLNEVSDGSIMDGSFGGATGKGGVSAMGIDSIRSSGGLAGKAKFYISNKDGRISISARIGGETVTNTFSRDDKETTFTFSGGKTITLGFGKGAGKLQTGVVTNVDFLPESRTADLKNASSSGKKQKDFTIDVEYVSSTHNRVLPMPRFIDSSAMGLGLDGLDISGITGAKKAAGLVNSAISKVANLRSALGVTKGRMIKKEAPIRQTGGFDRSVTASSVETVMASTVRTMEKQAAESIQAQTSQLSQQRMLSLLIA